MTILYIRELNEGRDGVSNTESIDIGGQYTRVFLVENDLPTYYASAMITATCGTGSIPVMGSAFPTDANSIVVQITAHARPDDMYRWEVVVRYDISGSPILEHPEVDWGSVNYQKPFTKDVRTTFAYIDLVIGAASNLASSVTRPFTIADVGNTLTITGGTGFVNGTYTILSVTLGIATLSGAAGATGSSGGIGTLGPVVGAPGANPGQGPRFPSVTNSAGDPFDPPAMKDDTRFEFTITRNYFFTGAGSFPFSLADLFKDALNASNVTIEGTVCAPRTLKIMTIGRKLFYKNSVKYWRVTIRIQRDPLTWDFQLLDQGYREWLAASSSFRAIYGAAGETHGKPVHLDGSGAKLGVGVGPTYLRYWAYNVQDFSLLNLTY